MPMIIGNINHSFQRRPKIHTEEKNNITAGTRRANRRMIGFCLELMDREENIISDNNRSEHPNATNPVVDNRIWGKLKEITSSGILK